MSKKEESKLDNKVDESKFVAKDTTPSEPGMKYDQTRGTEVPTHYPAAYLINEGEGESVKHPSVTPSEFNDKLNPQDAKTTDSEFIIRAPSMDKANKLAESERAGLPKADQDVTRSGDK
jgi:hypothetical protein